MRFVTRVSIPVVAFLLFQTADCGLAGRLMRQSREQGWANMTPQQQIRAVDDFFVAQGRPSQLLPQVLQELLVQPHLRKKRSFPLREC